MVDGRADDDRLRGRLVGNLLLWNYVLLFLDGLRQRADGGLQAELEFRLGGTHERLEDLRVVGVEGDVAAGGVGEALEDDRLLWFDGEQVTELWERERLASKLQLHR